MNVNTDTCRGCKNRDDNCLPGALWCKFHDKLISCWGDEMTTCKEKQ